LRVLGKYQERNDPPFTPGAEVAGIVSQIGAGVDSVRRGDRVMAFVGTGAFAEEVVADESAVVPIPNDVSFDIAAGFSVTYGTALHAFMDVARLQEKETVLVLGAAGGAGFAAVDTAKAMGARVVAAASSAQKLESCRRAGADAAIDYTRSDFKDALRSAIGKTSLDVVFDPVGGPVAEVALRELAWRGRYLTIGFASGHIPRLPLNLALLMERSINGVYWGGWRAREPRQARDGLRAGLRWVSQGRLHPCVGNVYPLDQAVAALRQLMDRGARGKIVVRCKTLGNST
jgi:NADPH2:quinone reductase